MPTTTPTKTAARPTAASRPTPPTRPIIPRPLWERGKLFQEPVYADGLGLAEDDEDDDQTAT